MVEQNRENKKDWRFLVLIGLGAGILATSLSPPKPELRFSDYYHVASTEQKYPLVVRVAEGTTTDHAPTSNFIKISADTSCTETPPRLAMFFDLPLPINRADQDELTMLPGIGSGLAEKIITFREKQGSITGAETLVRINGIGEKLKERLSPLLCFD